MDTGLLDTFLPLIKARYLDFIDRFEEDPAEALQPVCAPFTRAGGLQLRIHVEEQAVEKVRNTRAAGGVPPSGGIAWNAG